MALISCPECGREISDLTPNCPNCGRPIAAQSLKPNRRTGGRGWVIAIGVIVALLVAMFVSCPDEEEHRSEVQLVGEKTVKLMADEQDNAIVSGLATLFGSNIINAMINELFVYENYGIVSIGSIKDPQHERKSSLISFGVFGHVFTASPEQLMDKMSEKVKSAKDKLTNDLKEGINQEIDDAIDGALNSIGHSIEEGLDDAASLIGEDEGNTLDEDLEEGDEDMEKE